MLWKYITSEVTAPANNAFLKDKEKYTFREF